MTKRLCVLLQMMVSIVGFVEHFHVSVGQLVGGHDGQKRVALETRGDLVDKAEKLDVSGVWRRRWRQQRYWRRRLCDHVVGRSMLMLAI